MRRLLRYILSWSVTVGLLLWVLHRVPWGEVWARAAGVWTLPLIGAMALSILGNAWFACEKYRLILRSLGTEMSPWEVVLLKLGSAPLKGLLPLKSGELVRLVYLRRNQGLSYAKGAASVVLNLGWTVVALGLMVVPGHLGQWAGPLGWAAGPVLVILLASSMLLGARRWATSGHCGRPVSWLPAGAMDIWRGLWGAGPGHMARLLGLSVAFEGIKVLNYALVFAAMGIMVPWGHFFRTVPLLILFSSLPVSVMGLGLREGGVLLGFSGAAADSELVGAGLWISFVEAMVPVLVGLLLLRPFMSRLMDGDAVRGGQRASGA